MGGADKFEGKGDRLTGDQLLARIPGQHKAFVAELLNEHGIEAGQDDVAAILGQALSDDKGEQLLEVCFRHPIKLIANALGVPPQYMIDRAKAEGVPIAALVGAKVYEIGRSEEHTSELQYLMHT